jgi:outer membrane immunogenic protein
LAGATVGMRKIASLAGLTLFLAGPAFAADLPRTPLQVSSAAWTGCYIGGTAGGLSAKSDVSWAPNPPGFGSTAPIIATQTRASLSSTGFTGGGEVGCNYQMNNWFVLGAEGDFEYTGVNLNNSGAIFPSRVGSEFTESVSSKWLSTIRGRVGVAQEQLLFFATGGLAIADPSFSDFVFFPFSGTTNAASSSGAVTGWSAGGGAEWFFMPQWSLKAEYLYVGLGTKSITSTNSNPATFPLATIVHNQSLVENIGRVGLNFHF